MSLGPTEWLIILLIVLLLFGSTKVPKLARSLGHAQREFRKGIEESDTDESESDRPPV